MQQQPPVQLTIHCSGHHYILNQKHQEEVVHLMIQEAAAVKVLVLIKVKVVAHPQEEEPEDVEVQEEEHPLHQVDTKEAVLPQAIHHHSRQEEQGVQAVLHIHLQG